MLFAIPAKIAFWVIALEFILHYHIDWFNSNYGFFQSDDDRHWQWIGAEQFLNHITYIMMVALVIHFDGIA